MLKKIIVIFSGITLIAASGLEGKIGFMQNRTNKPVNQVVSEQAPITHQAENPLIEKTNPVIHIDPAHIDFSAFSSEYQTPVREPEEIVVTKKEHTTSQNSIQDNGTKTALEIELEHEWEQLLLITLMNQMAADTNNDYKSKTPEELEQIISIELPKIRQATQIKKELRDAAIKAAITSIRANGYKEEITRDQFQPIFEQEIQKIVEQKEHEKNRGKFGAFWDGIKKSLGSRCNSSYLKSHLICGVVGKSMQKLAQWADEKNTQDTIEKILKEENDTLKIKELEEISKLTNVDEQKVRLEKIVASKPVEKIKTESSFAGNIWSSAWKALGWYCGIQSYIDIAQGMKEIYDHNKTKPDDRKSYMEYTGQLLGGMATNMVSNYLVAKAFGL